MPLKTADIYGAVMALRAGSPDPSFYMGLADLILDIVHDANVHPELGVPPMTAPPPLLTPTPVVGTGKPVALKPADFYGAAAALRAKCPPASSQAKFYTDVAQLVLDVLADADVEALGLVAPPGGGPVTGLAKIT